MFGTKRSQNKTSCRILPKIHGIGEGVDPNLRPEKWGLKPLSTRVQSQVPNHSKFN